MGYVTPEQIAQAKEWDLLTYLQRYDPHQLVHVGGSTYCTREHDSLKISNGKWNWFSRKIGGKTALDYLIKVQGFSLSRNPVCTQEQTGSRTYMSEKTAKRNKDNRSLHFHVANFFKFMAANLSFTQFVT